MLVLTIVAMGKGMCANAAFVAAAEIPVPSVLILTPPPITAAYCAFDILCIVLLPPVLCRLLNYASVLLSNTFTRYNTVCRYKRYWGLLKAMKILLIALLPRVVENADNTGLVVAHKRQ